MGNLLRKMGWAALVLAASADAAAAPPAPTALPSPLPQGERVRIAFSPPLGIPIRYRFTTIDQAERGTKTAAAELSLVFRQVADGYVMVATYAFPGAPAAALADPAMQLALRPMAFRLSSEAEITGLEDEAAYWTATSRIMERLATGPKVTPEGVAVLRDMVDHMRQLPDEQRLALLTRNLQPAVEMAATEWTVGQVADLPAEQAEIPIPLPGGVKLTRRTRLTVQRADAAEATFVVETSTDPRDLEQMVRQLQALAPAGTQAAEAATLAGVQQRITLVVSRVTGLTRWWEEEISVSGTDNGKPSRARKIRRLERL